MVTSPKWIVALLAMTGVSLATLLAPTAQQRSEDRGSESFLKAMMGDGRRLFAKQFFTKADMYFHGGYYPSIFDQANQRAPKAIAQRHDDDDEHHEGHEGHEGHAHEGHDGEHEEGMDFIKEPRDWIERFGRNFTINEHTHLAENQQREMLPWLRIAAEMDPQMIATYTTAAYWLRKEKGHVDEARQFLLEGLRNNPKNDELLFELGSLYYNDLSDANRARNVMASALTSWFARPAQLKTNNEAISLLGRIAVNLARIERDAGNYPESVRYFELGKTVSPSPEGIQLQIEELRRKIASGTVLQK